MKVSAPTIINWIANFGESLPEPRISEQLKEVEWDEMWHFIAKKNKKYGSGEPWIVLAIEPLDGMLGIVLLKAFKNFSAASST